MRKRLIAAGVALALLVALGVHAWWFHEDVVEVAGDGPLRGDVGEDVSPQGDLAGDDAPRGDVVVEDMSPHDVAVEINRQAAARPLGEPFNVTMLLLMSKNFRHPAVWDYWTHEADEWTAKTFGKGKVVLNFAMHNPIQNATEALPAVIGQRAVSVKRGRCRWGHTTPCMYMLLRGAKEAFPDSAFYIFVSHCTVPIKPFSYMYEDMRLNPRSRFNLTSLNWPYAPRHSQWIVLNNNHAAQLVARHDLWATNKFCDWTAIKYPDGSRLGAADDETCPLRILTALALFGEDLTKKDYSAASKNGTFPEWGGLPPPSLWEQINDGTVPRPSHEEKLKCTPEEHSRMFVCFTECWRFGRGTIRAPTTWLSIFADEMRDVMHLSNVWFARKMVNNVKIIDFDAPLPEEAEILAAMEKQEVGSAAWKENYGKLLEVRRSKKRGEGREDKTVTGISDWLVEELKKGQRYGPSELTAMRLDALVF